MRLLYQTVRDILDTGRIGVPVFMRCTVQIAPENGYVEDVLVRILAMACSWLGSSALKVYAQGSNDSMQLTVSIHYVDGKTAVASVSASPGAATGVDLMVLGNKGGLYHGTEALAPGFDVTVDPLPIPEWLIDAVERSLESGKPEVIGEATGFE